MPSQESKILFIGAGKWSAKVSEILRKQDPKTHVNTISARNFLDLVEISPEYIRTLDKLEFIWITTNPGFQLQVLRKLQSTKCKVILEKPIARNHQELAEIKDLISKCTFEIYLSQPWSFSETWTKFLEILEQKNNLDRVSIVRGGENLRTDVVPELDWIPHDLYLAAFMADKLGVKESQINVEIIDQSPGRILLGIDFVRELRIEIEAGFFPSRIAKVSGYSSGKEIITGNFQTGEVRDMQDEGIILEFSTDTSILNMLKHYRLNSSNLNWELIFKLYLSVLK